MGTKLEESEYKDGVRMKTEYEVCRGCSELQNQITKEERSLLELVIGKKDSVIALLEGKRRELEDEVRILKQKNEELEQSLHQDKMEEEGKILQLMIENNVLECEKMKAESDVKAWKVKYEELKKSLSIEKGAGLLEVDSPTFKEIDKSMLGFKGIGQPGFEHTKIDSKAYEDGSDSPLNNTPSKQYASGPVMKQAHHSMSKSSARKSLSFTNKKSLDKGISPVTPSGRSPFDPIGLDDSDDDLHAVARNLPDIDVDRRKVCISTNIEVGTGSVEKQLGSRDALDLKSDEEDAAISYGRKQHLSVRKKRRHREVFSDSESDVEDNVPIITFLRPVEDDSDTSSSDLSNNVRPTRKRRLSRLGVEDVRIQENLDTETVDDDETEQDESGSDSIDEFIVSSSDSDQISEHNDDMGSGNASDSGIQLGEILSFLRRERKDKTKWDHEGYMLADFGKSPELCMKAVCAIYRQQTADEKSSKATINCNGRGFSQCHAFRGSKLAEFLTDGDPSNDVMKSVEELQEFNREGVKQCRKLAKHYSKQLFEIYEKKEDPFFGPLEKGAPV